MRIAQIRKMDISNGSGIGVSIFTRGCPYHCPNCHNASIWGFNGRQEYTEETKQEILRLIKPDYIHRFSILGGEPLLPQNVHDLKDLIFEIRKDKPQIEIWLWTGTTIPALGQLLSNQKCDDAKLASFEWTDESKRDLVNIILQCDYIIDGRFEENKKDLTLKWRGSSNQKIWDYVELDELFNTPR